MAKADLMKKPEMWGVNELLKFLFVCICASPGQKITIRKDVMKAVPDNYLELIEVIDIGHSVMLKGKERARKLVDNIVVPRGGIWTPSGN
jgi:hypothetical protein